MLIFRSVNFQIQNIDLETLNKINITISDDKCRSDSFCTMVTDI